MSIAELLSYVTLAFFVLCVVTLIVWDVDK